MPPFEASCPGVQVTGGPTLATGPAAGLARRGHPVNVSLSLAPAWKSHGHSCGFGEEGSRNSIISSSSDSLRRMETFRAPARTGRAQG